MILLFFVTLEIFIKIQIFLKEGPVEAVLSVDIFSDTEEND